MLYVVVYVLGVATGFGLMVWNNLTKQKLIEEYEAEKDDLAKQISSLCDQLQKVWRDDAYRNGYEQGRLNPYDEAERFARSMAAGKQNIKFQLRSGDSKGA